MRGFRSVSLLVLAPFLAATADSDDTVREAVSQYDMGNFGAAIELLEGVLAREPGNGLAGYELAMTHQAIGDLPTCIRVAETTLHGVREDPGQQHLVPELSMLLGSCYSASGDSGKALEVFLAALETAPDNYGLNFNVAITYSNTGDPASAVVHLERAIRARPAHPSAYYVIALAYQALGRHTESLLAHFSFLQYEFNTERTVLAARSAIDAAYANVSRDNGEVAIYVDSETDSEVINVLGVLLGTSAAVSLDEDGQIRDPVADSIANLFEVFVTVTAEIDDEEHPESILAAYLLPNTRRVEAAGSTRAFCYYVLTIAGVEGADEWLQSHEGQLDNLVQTFEMIAAGDPE